MNPQPGEIWLADLGLAAKTRPVVVVSRYDPNPPRAMTTYVPLTTQYRHSPYEIVLPKLRFLDSDSIANVQGLGSIPKVRLERRLGKLSNDVMAEIKNAISFALDLEVETPKPTDENETRQSHGQTLKAEGKDRGRR